MFKNYFKTAIRNIWRNKSFSFINIAGLAIGISAALIIYLIVYHEFNYEKFQNDGKLIYRVVTDDSISQYKNSGVPGPLPAAIRSGVPGIKSSTVFWLAPAKKITVPSGTHSSISFVKQDEIIYADEHYFQVFNYKWLAGPPDYSLSAANKVVLTESRAKTYFPYTDIGNAIGQTIIYDDTVKAVVSGIVKDLNEITDFTFKEFISLSTFRKNLEEERGWGDWNAVYSNTQFFVKLQNNADKNNIDKTIAQLNKNRSAHGTVHILQPLFDIHFSEEFDAFDHRQARRSTLYGLIAIAVFLLLLGSINFVNLTTAHSLQRAKEIGIRKAMGGSKWQLMMQFLCETTLLTAIATALSVILIPSILKLFSGFVPEGLNTELYKQPNFIAFIVVLNFAVSILSGIYPAFILSGFKPVLVLKNQILANTKENRTVWIRKSLTVLQFVIAQFFVIATLVVVKQIRYGVKGDLGYKKEAIINFGTPYKDTSDRKLVLLEKLKKIRGIQEISLSSRPPATTSGGVATMPYLKNGETVQITSEQIMADTSYIGLYKIKLLAGRNFRVGDDESVCIVNEELIKRLGYKYPAEIIGKSFSRDGFGTVIGVIADIHTKSFHQPIIPLKLFYSGKSKNFNVALSSLHGSAESWKTTIAEIGKAYKEIFPEAVFSYRFFDESIAQLYKRDNDTATLLKWSAGLMILISILGLLGLVLYSTVQRRKEIGIRKVLGASVFQVVLLISANFIKLVLIAFLIAIPIGWWAMNRWLQDFAYRTSLSWWVFALTGFAMMIITLLTLSLQIVRSASANPVVALRSE